MKPKFRSNRLFVGSIALFATISALDAASLTWDPGKTGTSDGVGTWLATEVWWDGLASATWNNDTPDNATIGNGGTGGTITLGTVTAGSVLLDDFTGTYTFDGTGSSLTQSGGITIGANAGNVTIRNTVIGGTGGITMNGAGRFVLGSNPSATHTFSGDLVINNGVTMVGGVATSNLGSGNLTMNGGVLEFYWGYTFARTLGAAAGQVQILGGSSGFSMNGATGSSVRFNNSNSFQVKWGSSVANGDSYNFMPSELVLNTYSSQAGASLTFDNPLDLDGANRTIRSGATAQGVVATMARTISNSDTENAAGLIKEGPGLIVLSAANSYDGGTTISGGILRFVNLTSMPATGAVAVQTGATLAVNLGGGGQWTTGTSGEGTIGGLLAGLGGQSGSTVSYSGDVNLGFETTGTQTYSDPIGNVGDSLGIVKSGGGTLVLTGNNSYAGMTRVRGGTLSFDSIGNVGGGNSALGAPSTVANGTIALGERATAVGLTYTGTGHTSDRVIELAGSTGAVTINASGAGALVLNGNFVPTWPTTGNNQASKTLTLTGSSTAANTLGGVIPNLTVGTGTNNLTLSKTGDGTWILGGANTYSGTTTISAGKLSINGSLSNANVALTVASGATLGGIGTVGRNSLDIATGRNFAFSGASELTITSSSGAETGTYVLVTGGNNIGGVAPATLKLPAGWSASASIVDNQLLLNVTSIDGGGNTFADWIATYPGVGAFTGVGDDADGDGIDNGVENFFGTNPSVSNSGLVAGAVGVNTFTFTHPQNATPASDLTATYQWSKDLATFYGSTVSDGSTTVTLTPALNTPVAGTTTVTASVTGTATSKLFVNIKVTQP
jgi:autotransporter-associated beta strand protein